MGRRLAIVGGLYGLLALLVVPVFPHFQSPNELTRWVTAAALVEHGSLEVTPLLPLLRDGFEDLSVSGTRTYSNKAPGAALVSLPGYLAVRAVTGGPSADAMRSQVTGMRLAGATLPALLLAGLVLWAAARCGAEVSRLPAVLLALLFATPLFAYGLLLFAHALVAACLFGAWTLLFVPTVAGPPGRKEVAAGALLGLAVLSEYPAAVPAVILVALAASRRDARRPFRVVLGGLPFAVFLAAFNRLCFGGVLELSSAHEKFGQFRSLAASGLFGIGMPSPRILASLLLSPAKGLLVFSPFLLLAAPALASAYRTLPRDAFRGLVAVPAALLLTYGGYPNWHGGWTVGPRYLVAALPFLVFPLAFREGGRLEAVLLGWSVTVLGLTALVFPFVPPEFPWPWGSFSLPLLARGLVAPNAFHLLWRPLALVAPFFLVAAAVFVALRGRRRFALVGAGAALAAGLFVAGQRLPIGVRLERAYIEDVFFERRGAMEGVLGPVPVPEVLDRRREMESRLGPAPWPF